MTAPTEQWEQRVLHATATDWQKLDRWLVMLGAEGWEAVAMTGADKTLGLNAVMAIVRRRIVPPPPPAAGSPATWYPDPCNRYEHRWWAGTHWTARVKDAKGHEGADAPQTLERTVE